MLGVISSTKAILLAMYGSLINPKNHNPER